MKNITIPIGVKAGQELHPAIAAQYVAKDLVRSIPKVSIMPAAKFSGNLYKYAVALLILSFQITPNLPEKKEIDELIMSAKAFGLVVPPSWEEK